MAFLRHSYCVFESYVEASQNMEKVLRSSKMSRQEKLETKVLYRLALHVSPHENTL